MGAMAETSQLVVVHQLQGLKTMVIPMFLLIEGEIEQTLSQGPSVFGSQVSSCEVTQ